MNCVKIGKLIQKLRKEKAFTQKTLAEKLNISDKAISKWERGMGCPDISLWPKLSDLLGADIKKMFEGELYPNEPDVGNISRISFYVCKDCGNIMTSTGKCTLSCCGRKLSPLQVHQTTQQHNMNVELIEDNYYVTLDHNMSKDHYILFIAFVTSSTVWLNRLYPEQSAETRFPAQFASGSMYAYCKAHGLVSQRIVKKNFNKVNM